MSHGGFSGAAKDGLPMLQLASISSTVTTWIAENGVYAVFALMALDALLPVGGELVMLYAGVIASGAIAGHEATLLGAHLGSGAESYLALALAGTLGYLIGSLLGWELGRRGGRPLILRHGRWLHLSEQSFARAERWFDRHGRAAVLLGRITPLVRSFISVPAGVLGTPLGSYTALTALGSAIWCFAFAAAGWALGGSWHGFHDAFRYADYAAVALAVAGAALLGARIRRARAAASRT